MIGALGLLYVSLAGCDAVLGCRVDVTNRSAAPLTEVEVSAGGKLARIGALAPGSAATVYLRPGADSDVRVRYRSSQGGVAECVGDVYVTNGSRQTFEVSLGPNGACEVLERR